MLVWHGSKVEQKLKASMRRGVRESCLLLESIVKGSMRKGGRTESGELEMYAKFKVEGGFARPDLTAKGNIKKRYRDPVTGKEYGGRQPKINTYTSQPGEPPRVQTGTLRRSITHEVDPVLPIGRVGTNLPYGKWLEFGIPGGKTIKPVSKKVLSWTTGGRRYFAKQVKQGAIKPRPFMLPAARKAEQMIARIMAAAGRAELV